MNQFSKQELETMLMQAHRDYETAVDPDKTDFTGNEFVAHMAQLSIAQSMLVIADNLTAMRYNDNVADTSPLMDEDEYVRFMDYGEHP